MCPTPMIERHLNTFAIAFLGVGIVLFLTVFVQTPGCLRGPYVRVPFASSASILPGSERDLEIRIARDGKVLVGLNYVPLQKLPETLAAIADSDRKVVLSADRVVPFSLVQDVLRISRDAGFKNVTLVTFEGQVLEAYTLGARNI